MSGADVKLALLRAQAAEPRTTATSNCCIQSISEKKVPLIPLGVMGWAGTEGQNGLPESDRTESRSWLHSYSCEAVGKSFSKNLPHLGNRGVHTAILSLLAPTFGDV